MLLQKCYSWYSQLHFQCTYKEPYSPTLFSREYGHFLPERYANSKSSWWKKRWHGCEIATGMSGNMFLFTKDRQNDVIKKVFPSRKELSV